MSAHAATIGHAQPQHLKALEAANRVRVARAGLKRKIADGQLDVPEVILTCPWMVETMALGELLTAALAAWVTRAADEVNDGHRFAACW